MRLCPLDLESCHRPECASGYCADSCETALYICAECGATGTRIEMRRVTVCAACAAQATPNDPPAKELR